MIICVGIRAVEPDFKKSNKKPDATVGYRRLYPTFAQQAAAAAAVLTAALTAILDHKITEAVCGQEKICTHCVRSSTLI